MPAAAYINPYGISAKTTRKTLESWMVAGGMVESRGHLTKRKKLYIKDFNLMYSCEYNQICTVLGYTLVFMSTDLLQ
jgi:hypothetical protein